MVEKDVFPVGSDVRVVHPEQAGRGG